MTLVNYRGMFDQVEIGETGQLAARNRPLEVPDDVADRLLLAEDWERADTGPLEGRTKAELLARADQLGIEGRHAMSKDELVEAVRGAS
ncbi:MAG: Rho termination factor N-terminal domain-containing protein [Actinomycetota bacterium]|nr:Rho termination factor N-terminal domain-containing protein [Actinomycetota bacterium]